jgi:hypothetical protein
MTISDRPTNLPPLAPQAPARVHFAPEAVLAFRKESN